MLPYFKKYVVIACAFAALVPVVVSTGFAFSTGTILASTIQGLVTLLALFFGTFLVSTGLLSKVADAKVDEMIAIYDGECDPERFLDASREIAAAVTVPFPEPGAWFMSFYGQALLDAGDVKRAEAVEKMMYDSIARAKKRSLQAAIVVALLPLALKTKGPAEALPMIDKGLGLLNGIDDQASVQRRGYLATQREIVSKRLDGDTTALIALYEGLTSNEVLPLRIRVESAWDEAQLHYSLGHAEDEARCLRFVSDYGNKLVLVGRARARLAELS